MLFPSVGGVILHISAGSHVQSTPLCVHYQQGEISLMPSSCVPPSKKQSGEQSRISSAYFQKGGKDQ